MHNITCIHVHTIPRLINQQLEISSDIKDGNNCMHYY